MFNKFGIVMGMFPSKHCGKCSFIVHNVKDLNVYRLNSLRMLKIGKYNDFFVL